MHLCFNEVAQEAFKAYETFEYSRSCRSASKIAIAEFEEYMAEKGLPYSTEIAQRWIDEKSGFWTVCKLKNARKALDVIADIVENGQVTTSLRNTADRKAPYTRLPDWSKAILDDYLGELGSIYKPSYLLQIKQTCSHFFLFLEAEGVKHPSEIIQGILDSFLNSTSQRSSRSANRSKTNISRCLLYMADKGLVPRSFGLLVNRSAMPDLVIVSELDDTERSHFARFNRNVDSEHSNRYYDAAVDQLAAMRESLRYSVSMEIVHRQAASEFRAFMDVNALVYSHDLALEWLELHRTKWSYGKYLTFRRFLLLLNEVMCSGTVSSRVFSTHKPKHIQPQWASDLVIQYLQEREREGCARSTLDMIRNACRRFVVFLDNYGICAASAITPASIKAFHAQDVHCTVQGKNAYTLKIRGFLRFLARKGLVRETLELALSTDAAPRTSIVRTLSDSQIDTVYTARNTASSAMDLRNTAMVMLGLRMGLRQSDIVNLRLTDISWQESSISLVQQKTNVYLKIPLPVDVGNSLFRYISEGRPQSDSQHVFVSHRAPYCEFVRGQFSDMLRTMISDGSEGEDIDGFHITRKTFASKLLETGAPVPLIAAALGHVGVSAIDEYLATDGDRMSICAIGLQGIPYRGEFEL